MSKGKSRPPLPPRVPASQAPVGQAPVGQARSGSDSAPDLAFQRAVAAYQRRDLAEVDRCCTEILRRLPTHADALHLLGITKAQQNQFRVAANLFARAVKLQPGNAGLHALLGKALLSLGEAEAAAASLSEALRLKPDLPEAMFDKAMALLGLARLEEAVALFDAVLRARPGIVPVLYNRGTALLNLRHFTEALRDFDEVLRQKPDFAEAHNNRGTALRRLNRPAEALASFDRSLAHRPGHMATLINRGTALFDLGRLEEALACYDLVLSREPQSADALFNRSVALRELKRYDLAVADLSRLIKVALRYDYALGYLLHAKLCAADWAGIPALAEQIHAALARGEKCATPFAVAGGLPSPSDQLKAAEIYVADKFPPAPAIWRSERYRHDRIRLAYLSADFHNHATAYLMAELFETHDRARFETTAISFGPLGDGRMRTRLERAFDRFLDVKDMSDPDVARHLRQQEIDIAVDLKGFTEGGRTGILAHRPAPVQVNYLGFPGTMAASYIDYLIADPRVVPAGSEAFYREKIVRLPESYQVNDRQRRIAAPAPRRATMHLPDEGFVFCCFNNSFKLSSDVFAVWMRLLAAVEGSVLWLLEDNAVATGNLKAAVARHGIAPERLVFAPRIPLEHHLARHALADLFLDTLPYNAHTTTSDALWAGLPVLTCTGQAFASRVAASLLTAMGLPQLITNNMADYEALALKLATSPDLLAAIRNQLAQQRLKAPLFDTDRFRRHIEAAYVTMWERSQQGLPPVAFDVAPQDA